MKQYYRHGQKNPKWTGGKSEGFILRVIKQRIKESGRKINICEQCGVTDKNIDIHHKDGNRTHNTSDNLMVLCRSCHRIAHSSTIWHNLNCFFCN